MRTPRRSILSLLLPLALAVLGGCVDRELPTALAPAGAAFTTMAVSCHADPTERVAALIAAIEAANDETASPGPDTIELTADCTYTLTIPHNDIGLGPTGLPLITSHITINGNGATIERSSAAGTPEFRFFRLHAPSADLHSLTLNDLTLRNGRVGTTDSGTRWSAGAISAITGPVTLNRATLTGNHADGDGGAIAAGQMTLNHSAVVGNTSVGIGGGILAGGMIRHSTLSGNTANSGGAIFAAGPLTIENSTISGNTATTNGGGVLTGLNPVTLRHVTITGNHAGGLGGGIRHNTPNNRFTVIGCLIAGNTAGTGAPDVGAVVTSSGYNLIGDASGSTGFTATGDQVGTGSSPVNAMLGALGNNGGPMLTHALLAGSPAIDAGDPDFGNPDLPYDQRGSGFARVSGGRIDIGAFEVQAYSFSGFFAPVDNLPTVNVARAGSGIPVKFSLGGDQGLSIFASGSPTAPAVSCNPGDPTDSVTETVSAGSSSLSYDASTGQYTYVWKTDKAWANTCRTLTLTFTDGTTQKASFKFTR
jgi:predicted outer membrane repeat protein